MRLLKFSVVAVLVYLFSPLFLDSSLTDDILYTPFKPCKPAQHLLSIKNFKNGFNFADYDGVGLSSQQSLESLQNARKTGITWIAVVVTGFQSYASGHVTDIFPVVPYTPAPDEVYAFISEARRLNLRVMLKFHINLQDDPKNWSGNLGKKFNEEQWLKWFANYRMFVDSYLTGENVAKVDILCIGNELTITEKRNKDWRELIAYIRTRYDGKIVYGANWWPGPQNVSWWDALDYIGISYYRGLAKNKPPSIENLVKAWETGQDLPLLKKLSVQYGKPVIFTEIGYRSIQGANLHPYEYPKNYIESQKDEKINFIEQANLYYAVYRIARFLPWLDGIFWWEWDANPQKGGAHDNDYTPYGKPTENLIPLFSCMER